MLFRFIVAGALATLAPWAGLSAPAASEPPALPTPAAASGTAPSPPAIFLSPQALAGAAKVDSMTIPSPGESMAALNKEGKPNWQSVYRAPIPTNFSNREQIALNIGGLIADGYMAVEAEDSQQVKNIGKDIITLAKSLAVSESVIARGHSIFDFAENNQWSALKEELDATQNEVKLALEQHKDNDLVSLVTLGGWIRATEATSTWISDNYTPAAAKLLRQPGIVATIRAKIAELPPKVQSEPLLETVNGKLAEIQRLVSFPSDSAPTVDEVKRLRELSKRLEEAISKKRGD